MMDPFQVVRDFEKAVGEYTGAPYVVTVNSCSAALHLCFEWWREMHGVKKLYIPCRTYPSVLQGAIHAGHRIVLKDWPWEGVYRICPLGLWDCAKRFTGGMYEAKQVQCVSFHARKLLPIGSGGAILLDNPDMDRWLRKARFDGRTEGVPTSEDTFSRGWHYYMRPDDAARGLHLLSYYPATMPDQPMDNYPDLRKHTIERPK